MPERDIYDRYNWEPAMGGNGRYRDLRNGQFISPAAVRADLDEFIAARNDRITQITTDLIEGRSNIANWQRAMREEIRDMHRAAASVGRGGWRQMSQSDWGWTGQRIQAQYRYLDGFAADIASGKQALDGRAVTRARMYTDAARGTQEGMVRRMSANAGLTEERRVLGAADHCPDCLDYAGRGWQPIGTLPAIGVSVCRTNCKCTFEYR